MSKPRKFRLKHPRLSENDVERACLDLLRLRGYWVIRQQSGLFKTPDNRWIRLGKKGVPDYATVHHHFPGFLLEVKRPGASPTPEQVVTIRELHLGYRLAIGVVDSVAALQEWLPGLFSADWPAHAAHAGCWVRLVTMAASAIDAAHRHGLVHGRPTSDSFVL